MGSGLNITAFSTRRGKRRKITEMANAAGGGEEDIISNKLPESVISHVLSFLPTKDAVRTCVLSKRWKDRWTYITKLDLHDHSHKPKPKPKGQRGRRRHNFVNFVNKALVLTDGLGLTMEGLSLLIRGKYNVSLLDTWLSNIFNRRVKNLRIHSHFKLPFSAVASHYLFSSSTSSLEELELLMMSNSISTIQVPHNIYLHFGHLKLLNLCGIFFNFDSSDGYSILSFPVLKKFETKNCSWVGVKGVIVNAPLLETISIELEADIRTAESHLLSPSSLSFIRFGVLHLKEFTYCGYGISRVIYLADFNRRFDAWSPCSASAKIILNPFENKVDRTIAIALQLLQQFSQAKRIIFEGSEILTAAQLLQQTLPALTVFAMLSHLELGLAAVEVILGLLLKTPVLKTPVLKGISKFAEELLKSAVVPDCLASLRVVKFEKVNGDKHEIFLANFFMENGMMLERMYFYFDSQRPAILEVMQEFKEKLYSFNNLHFDIESSHD